MNALITKSFSRLIVVLACFIFLSACETKLGTDELRIVNNLPTSLTYYVKMDAPIELAGGEGGYSVRYIQNPEAGMSEDDIDGADGDNPVALEVIRESGSRNRFRLVGLPVPTGLELELKTHYWIEISDGSSSKIIRSELEIGTPQIDVENFASLSFEEAGSNLSNFTGAINRNIPLCDQAYEAQPQPKITPYGMAYPNSLLLGISQRLLENRLEFEYQIQERTGSDSATENADFIKESGSFVLEPGQLGCPIYVYILDDSEIEGVEQFEVQVTSINGAEVKPVLSALRGVVRINDDEPEIRDFEGDYVVNVGESATLTATLQLAPTKQVFLPLRIDPSSTADDSLFGITPATRNLVFEPGEIQKAFSVTALAGTHTDSSDPTLVLSLGKEEPKTDNRVDITLNQWIEKTVLPPFTGEDYVGLSAEKDWVFAVSTFVDGAESKARVVATNKKGANVDFSGISSYVIEQAGVNLTAKDVHAFEAGGAVRVLVLLEVDGLFGSVTWGKKDFALVLLEVQNDSSLLELARSQHGSEEDDTPATLEGFPDDAFVLVGGESTGTSLDGLSVFPVSGQQDSFVYKVSADLANVRWSRFSGGTANDAFNSAVGNDDNVFVTGSAGNSHYINSFLASDASLGDDDPDLPQFDIGLSRPSNVPATVDLGEDRLALIADSDQDLDSNAPTPGGTRDVFVGLFEPVEEGYSSVINLATSGEDRAIGLSVLETEPMLLAAGNTLGQFDGETQFGVNGESDAFVASMEVSTTLELNAITQFGTAGDDQVIDIEPIADEKFLVLWKENHSSGDGTYRYRITPFSPAGENLVPLN